MLALLAVPGSVRPMRGRFLLRRCFQVPAMKFDFPESCSAASRYVREAIPKMVEHNIAPNPVNFALWYAYVSNRDFTLKSELDATLSELKTCPPAQARKFFDEYFLGDELERKREFEKSLDELIEELLQEAELSRCTVAATGECFETSLESIMAIESTGELRDCAKSLLATTYSASESLSRFACQLNSARAEIESLKQRLAARERDAMSDVLTGIGNRRHFDEALYQVCASGVAPVSLVLFDIDHFKSLNTRFGHVMGDKILAAVGDIIRKSLPAGAVGCRYGGEEFALLLENTANDAYALAEQLRQGLKMLKLRSKRSNEPIGLVTASFGVVQLLPDEFAEEFLERADNALYAAKDAGRDRVVYLDSGPGEVGGSGAQERT